MSGQTLLYLSREDVNRVGLAMKDVIAVVETAFMELGHSRVEMPPKPAIHPGIGGNNFINAMPAYLPALSSAGVKWVSAFPGNPPKGLPYITGLLVLNDVETGIPKAVMDCTWITGRRTAAASAISAKYLARPEAAVIGIIACGVQGHTNLEAMKTLFPLTQVKAFDVDPEKARRLAAFGRERLGLAVEIVDDPKAAVTGSDIVVTSGPILKKPHETIRSGWLTPGAFASLVDYDSYWSRNALRQADKWTTDYLPQYLHYRDHEGYFTDCPSVYADLGELVSGKKKGRERADEITFAANLGLAIEDMAVAPLVFESAVRMGIGTKLSL